MDNQLWLCFEAGTTDEEARAAFARRYGEPPAQVKRERGIVWAGPVAAKQTTTGTLYAHATNAD